MTIEKQMKLKEKCNRDAQYKKNWRELEDKMNVHTLNDFRLGKEGWQCDGTTVWWDER